MGEQQQQAAEEEGEEGAKYQPQVLSSFSVLDNFSLSYAKPNINLLRSLSSLLLFLTSEMPRIHPGCPPTCGAASSRGGRDETGQADGEQGTTPGGASINIFFSSSDFGLAQYEISLSEKKLFWYENNFLENVN